MKDKWREEETKKYLEVESEKKKKLFTKITSALISNIKYVKKVSCVKNVNFHLFLLLHQQLLLVPGFHCIVFIHVTFSVTVDYRLQSN